MTHRILRTLILSLLALAGFLLGAWVAIKPSAARNVTGTGEIRPGVVYSTVVDPAGPWRIHVVQIDMRYSELEIETARAFDSFLGRETVTSMALRRSNDTRRVIAALNGDYFNLATGEVQNNHISGGTFVKAFTSQGYKPEYVDIPNSQFAITQNRRLLIEQFTFAGSVLWADGTVSSLTGVNTAPRRGGWALFNSFMRTSMPAGLQLAVERTSGDTLVCIEREPDGGESVVLASFPPDDGRPDTHYQTGDSVRIVLMMSPHHGTIKELVGGWPRLVRNGVSIFDDPGFPENRESPMFTRRHPRSGIGFSRDSTTLYLLAVDGRQEGSAGMSLPEFATLMISLGVYQGLNLDGGGSTTLLVNGQLVNSPSDPTGERPVGNCVLLVVNTGRMVASVR